MSLSWTLRPDYKVGVLVQAWDPIGPPHSVKVTYAECPKRGRTTCHGPKILHLGRLPRKGPGITFIQKRLADALRMSTAGEREAVTRDVYNRLFDEVPWHDANVAAAEVQEAYEEHWFQCYGPLTRPEDILLDIGCGRGGLVNRFAPSVSEAIGLDASDAMVEIAGRGKLANTRFIVGNLLTPPLPQQSVDFVVSRQLMEHLHPVDVMGHLRAIYNLLRPGGRSSIQTPSRLTGPWDISRGFSADCDRLPPARVHKQRDGRHAEGSRILSSSWSSRAGENSR